MSASSMKKAVSLIPFGYYGVTRGSDARELGFLVATSWLPAIWILFRLGGHDLGWAIANFLLGYIAFIAIYELGYLINDAWDAARSDDGRKRLPFAIGAGYIGPFVLIRLAAWLGIGLWTGWLFNWVWLGGFAALALAFAQHNLIAAAWLRITSFFELSVFRFTLPVIGAIDPAHYLEPVMAALLFYTYLRYLSYVESKGVLAMPERRSPAFGLLQTLMLAPLVAWLAFLAHATLLVELFAYFLVVRGGWAMVARGRDAAKPA